MPGPPRTPREVRRRRGTLRKDRDGDGAGLTVLPSVKVLDSEDLDALSGAAMVQQILNAGASNWVGPTDAPAILRLLAEGWDERAALKRELDDMMGKMPEREQGDSAKDYKTLLQLWAIGTIEKRKQVRELEKQLTQWLSLLGLTPSDRARLGVAEVKRRSALEELRARAANRRKAGHRAG